MKPIKNTIRNAFAVLFVAALIAGACSPNSGEDNNVSENSTATSQTAKAISVSVSTTTTVLETQVEASVAVPFTATNGSGSVEISGDNSPLLAWFANQPGEVSLDLVNADVTDIVSVVEELVSFWFFADDDSGEVPPSIFESASGEITDSFGTRYVVEAVPLPAAPGTETTTTTTASAATSSTTTSSPETSEQATTSTTTTSAASTTTTTTTTAIPATTVPVVADLSPSQLQVQVLNGSGVAGAAGRLSASLRDAGYAVLPAGNAPQRFASSAVYYVVSEHRDEAEIVAEVVAESVPSVGEEDVAVASLPASGQIPSGDANVVVLIGRDDLGSGLQTVERSSGLKRTPDYDTTLPLPTSVPRDRYVPGLLDIQIFTEANDQGTDEMKGILNALSGWFNIAGRYQHAGTRAVNLAADLNTCDPDTRSGRRQIQAAEAAGTQCQIHDYEYLQTQVYPNIERSLEWLGFTPQNVCGAPAGYSFTDLMKPTREFDSESQNYTGDAIFTTDRLIELHGGQRINPEENLDFYIRQAVQRTHDALRLPELVDETETMQLLLCRAWLAPEGEIPEMANILFKSGFIPGVQPRESLLSQGTYHLKEISRNGNFAFLIVCHPTIGERYVRLWWREAGYRAEVTGKLQNNGCQATYEIETYREDTYGVEDIFVFSFGERVFSAGDLQEFPRG